MPRTPEDQKQEKIVAQVKASEVAAETDSQLRVDIFKTASAIIVYAQIAGASVDDFSVLIEGDDDVVTIKGQRTRPNGEHFEHAEGGEKEKMLEECSWGKFYRQIILPASVDAEKTEAKMREGVLMLYLPLKSNGEKGVKVRVVEI